MGLVLLGWPVQTSTSCRATALVLKVEFGILPCSERDTEMDSGEARQKEIKANSHMQPKLHISGY